MMKIPHVVGIGRAFIDVLADVDEGLITRYGLPKGMGLRIDQQTLQAIISDLKHPVYVAGGSVANSMSGFRALGADVTFIGKVGGDAAGDVFRADFEQEGVHFVNPPVSYGPSGCCLCLNTPDGERTFAFTVGVCEDITPEDVALTLFEGAEMMVFQLLMLETRVCYESMRDLYATLPPQIKKVFCLHDTQNMNQITPQMMDHVDILVGSRKEVAHILGVNNVQEVREIAAARCLIIAMTNGADGAILISPDALIDVPAVPAGHIIDTVGAGDLFASGFLYGLLQNRTLSDAGDLAVRCASLIIEQAGGRPTPETAVKMRALLG